ncbi:cobalamin-binding protein [Lentisalinibacter orientalis]|uniref:cobalamin-binding protein n=1 Tax=Lentisalinibacter orientalis TaxID=2992241 RepID=UPI00386BEE9D
MIRLALILLAASVGAGADPAGGPAEEPAGPPARVVTLAPHLAELVFAAGAGDRLAGVTAYTDYPPAAASLPRIGDAFRVDMERIAVIDPDLVLAWDGGTPEALSGRLRELGYTVMTVRTRDVQDVAAAIRRIGERLGTAETADRAAAKFLQELEAAVSGHKDARPLRVFYQVASRPLYTVNGGHYISELIRLCGGRNVFSDLDELAPVVTVESVLSRDPEVILAPAGEAGALERWRAWQSLAAVRAGNLRTVPPDTLARPSPRLVQGAADICAAIEASRRELSAAAP